MRSAIACAAFAETAWPPPIIPSAIALNRLETVYLPHAHVDRHQRRQKVLVTKLGREAELFQGGAGWFNGVIAD
jgi:hypothetical protein